MIVAHANAAFDFRRGAIWAALAAAPWIFLFFFKEIADDSGGRWIAGAIASPVALFFSLQSLLKMARPRRLVWIDGPRLRSSKFDKSVDELLSVSRTISMPRYGLFPQPFIVFEFSDGSSERYLASMVKEGAENIWKSIEGARLQSR